jgi:hypothetical protein
VVNVVNFVDGVDGVDGRSVVDWHGEGNCVYMGCDGRRTADGLLRLLAPGQLLRGEGLLRRVALRHAACRANQVARTAPGGAACEIVPGRDWAVGDDHAASRMEATTHRKRARNLQLATWAGGRGMLLSSLLAGLRLSLTC